MKSVPLLKSESDSREERARDELSQLPARMARMESDVDHIKSDVADIKVDIRRMDDRMRGFEERVDAKFDSFEQRFNAKIDGNRLLAEAGLNRLENKIEALQREFSSARIWALGLYIGLAAGLLLVMAKGFKWI